MLQQGTYGYHKVNENGWTPFLHHTGEFHDAERNVTLVTFNKLYVNAELTY